MVINDATDVSLTREINSLPSVGSMFLTACGIITLNIVLQYPIPNALPASICPLSTESVERHIVFYKEGRKSRYNRTVGQRQKYVAKMYELA